MLDVSEGLIALGVVTREQLQAAAALGRGAPSTLGGRLLAVGVPRAQLLPSLASLAGLPPLDDAAMSGLSPARLDGLDVSRLRRLIVAPLGMAGGVLHVAVASQDAALQLPHLGLPAHRAFFGLEPDVRSFMEAMLPPDDDEVAVPGLAAAPSGAAPGGAAAFETPRDFAFEGDGPALELDAPPAAEPFALAPAARAPSTGGAPAFAPEPLPAAPAQAEPDGGPAIQRMSMREAALAIERLGGRSVDDEAPAARPAPAPAPQAPPPQPTLDLERAPAPSTGEARSPKPPVERAPAEPPPSDEAKAPRKRAAAPLVAAAVVVVLGGGAAAAFLGGDRGEKGGDAPAEAAAPAAAEAAPAKVVNPLEERQRSALREAEQKLASGDAAAAVDAFTQAIDIDPASPLAYEALLGRGQARERAGDVGSAAGDYRRAMNGLSMTSPLHEKAKAAFERAQSAAKK